MFNSLQIGRAIAALAVVLHHATLDSPHFYGTAFSGFFGFGNIGVDFFFVLSGFIIYWSHKQDQAGVTPALTYAKKRFIRLYPPFILISLLMYLAYTLAPSLSMGTREIGMVPSFLLIPDPIQKPALSVSWTLMHELLFYSIFCIYFISPKILKAVAAVWAIAILVYAKIGTGSFWLNFLLSMHNLEFVMGMLVAGLTSKLKVQSVKTYSALIITGILMIVFFIMRPDIFDHNDFSTLYIGAGFALTTLGLVLFESQNRSKKINSKTLLFLGSASYSIYLVHNPALSILNRIAGKITAACPWIPIDVLFLLTAAAATGVGIIYYFLWEKPILKFFKKTLLPKKSLHGPMQVKTETS